MASIIYTPFKANVAKGEFDLEGDTLKVLLVGASSTAGTDEDAEFVGDIGTLDELAGSGGYSRKTLTTVSVYQDDAADKMVLLCDDITWATLTGTPQPKGAVVFKHVTNDADSPVIGYIDGSAWNNTNGSDYTLQVGANGILQLA